MKLAYILPMVLTLMAPAAFADGHGNSLLKTCAKECPGAKTEEDIHSCVTGKESDPKFKKTACAIAHAKHEKEEKSHSH